MCAIDSGILLTGIADLFKVKKFLKDITKWFDLGLALGLHYKALKKIETEQRDNIDKCLREMLAIWLQQEVDVSSWSLLKSALENIEENELAAAIPESKLMHNN